MSRRLDFSITVGIGIFDTAIVGLIMPIVSFLSMRAIYITY